MATLLDEADRVDAEGGDELSAALGDELSAAVSIITHEGLPRTLHVDRATSDRAIQQASDAGAGGVVTEEPVHDPDDELPDMTGLKMHEKVRLRAAHRRKMKQKRAAHRDA